MTNKSQEMLNESLSAVMDGQSSELDIARVLKESASDNAEPLRDTWRRYHLAGEIMRGENKTAVANLSTDAGFTSRVLGAIEAEDVVIADTSLKGSQTASSSIVLNNGSSGAASLSWSHRLGQVAVAASVAFAVLIGFQYVGKDDSSQSEFLSSETNNQQDSVSSEQLPGATVPDGFDIPSVSARTVSRVEGGLGQGNSNSLWSSDKLPSAISSESFAPGSQEERELRARLKQLILLQQEANAASQAQGLAVYPQAKLETQGKLQPASTQK